MKKLIKTVIVIIFSLLLFTHCSKDKTGLVKKEINGITYIKYDKSFVKNNINNKKLKKIFTLTSPKISSDTSRLFEKPFSGALDNYGNIFIADMKGGYIKKFSKENKYIKRIGRKGKGPGEFLKIMDIIIDKKNNLFVLDGGLNRVTVLSNNGLLLTSFNVKKIVPYSFALDSKGNILITSTFPNVDNNYVYKYSKTGIFLSSLCKRDVSLNNQIKKGKGGSFSSFDILTENLASIAVDDSDNIYLAFARPAKIEKFTKKGKKIMVINTYFKLKINGGLEGGKLRVGDIAYTDIAISGNLIVGVLGATDRSEKDKSAHFNKSIIDIFSLNGNFLFSYNKDLLIDQGMGYRINLKNGLLLMISAYNFTVNLYKIQ